MYTAFQLGVAMVAAYLYWPSQHVLEDIAVQRGQPSLHRFLFFAQIGRLQRERNALPDRMAAYSDQLADVKIWAER